MKTISKASAHTVLINQFPFVVNEIAENILRFVAKDVNRFTAQRLVAHVKDRGVEPMIEDILDFYKYVIIPFKKMLF